MGFEAVTANPPPVGRVAAERAAHRAVAGPATETDRSVGGHGRLVRLARQPCERRLFRLASCLAAVVVMAGACSEATPAPPPGAGALGGIRHLLQQRAASLQRGDAAGYLQPLAPAARAVEEPIARGAAVVSLTDISMVFVPGPDVDPEAPVLRAVPVQLLYSYRGLPADNFFSVTLTYDIERQGPTWIVTRSQPDPKTMPIWATGPVQVATSAHFLALSRPDVANASQALALAEQANSALVARLPVVSDPMHLMVLARDHTQLGEMRGSPTPVGIVAFASFVAEGVKIPRGRELTVDMDALFGAGASIRVMLHEQEVSSKEVFQHELGHLALTRYFARNIPGWVTEGAAMYLSGERRTLSWSHGVRVHTFDALSFVDLNKTPTLAGADEYAYANAAVIYLVQTFGPDRFWRFYSGFALTRDAAPGLLRKDYGFDEAVLDSQTRMWIVTVTANP